MSSDIAGYALRYKHGVLGPQWECSCGGWSLRRHPQSQPFETSARQRHSEHVRAALEGGHCG